MQSDESKAMEYLRIFKNLLERNIYNDENTMILKISNDGIFINEQEMYSWDQTNFPDKDGFGFRGSTPFFWRAEQKVNSEISNVIELFIVEYKPKNVDSFKDQKISSDIEALIFFDLKWKEIYQFLSYYKKKEFKNILEIETRKDDNDEPLKYNRLFDFSDYRKKEQTIKFEFPTKEMKFRDGYIEIEKHFKDFDQKLIIKIENNEILAKFEYVKAYFFKLLPRIVTVKGKITIRDYKIISHEFTCDSINNINGAYIQKIRAIGLDRIVSNAQGPLLNICTESELIDQLDEGRLNGLVDFSNDSLINQILRMQKVRNLRQLKYISSKLHDIEEKVRFTMTPKFGFIFFVRGIKMTHHVWELLDSNATYIWSFNTANVDECLRLTEIEINYIITNGRQSYLNKDHKEELQFFRVMHFDSEKEKGFVKWKENLRLRII